MLNGTGYTVGSITRALYSGVEGELPFEYWDKLRVEFIDLKGAHDHFATIDYSESPPLLFVGEYVGYDDLRLTNLRDDTFTGGARATNVKGLNCPQCGAPIELRTGELAQSVACPSCAAILDARDPNLAVLQAHQQRTGRVEPVIPLGTTGTIAGEQWQAIGFQVRGITVSGVDYLWREYLLWNAERGFRYLTEYDGHWNDVTVVKGAPQEVGGGTQPAVEYNGERFKHFQSAVATTSFALGEFPWQVRTGDHVSTDDYVSPPRMLSREKTDDEITWSLSTYTVPERVAEAFKLAGPLPRRAECSRTNPIRAPVCGRGLRGAFGLLALACGRADGRAIRPSAKRAGVHTDPTVLADDGRHRRVRHACVHARRTYVERRAANRHRSVERMGVFNLALLRRGGRRGLRAWSRGVELRWRGWRRIVARRVAARQGHDLPAVPPGRYYLRVAPEREPQRAAVRLPIRSSVKRDVPRVWPFLLAIVLLAIPPVLAYFRELGFEYARWRESDHPWSNESSDDDSDSDDE